MTYNRKLAEKFMTDLLAGFLKPLLDRVKEDHTLLLAIRENYINIYYRGGSLYKITPNEGSVGYNAVFDTRYDGSGRTLPIDFPFRVMNPEDVSSLIEAMPELKYRMDVHFSKSTKSEREFQQLVVRENNFTSQTHYFIVDIEIAGILPGARFDMLAVRWLSHERNRPGTLVPALIEMKYGIGALDGVAGLESHLKDAYALRSDSEQWDQVVAGLEEQFNQLHQLGLITFNPSTSVTRLQIDRNSSPELIFLLAGYNPGSTKLLKILEAIDDSRTGTSGFDLLFFISSFAGYAMYREAMLTLDLFKKEVTRLLDLASITRRRTPGLDKPEDGSDAVVSPT